VKGATRSVLGLCLLMAAASCSGGRDSVDDTADGNAANTGQVAQSIEAEAASLEAIIAFSDTVECIPSDPFETLLGQMAPMDEIGRPIEPFAPRITLPAGLSAGRPRLSSENHTHDVTLPFDSKWHELRLTGITRWWTEESDHQGFTLHFRNAPGEVAATLNRLGFDLSAEGTRTVEDEVSTFLSVNPQGAGATFTCSIG
jgi:hypothetical protein